MRNVIIVVELILTMLLIPAFAKKSEYTQDTDTIVEKEKGWTIFPVISYSSETALQLGAMGNFYKRLGEADKNSYIEYFFAGTTKRHLDGELLFDIYLPNNVNHLITEVRFLKYPENFYGIGNNTPESAEEPFDQFGTELKNRWYRSLSDNFALGVSVTGRYTHTKGYDSDKQLASGHIPGVEDWFIWGAGPALLYDSRDNDITTRKGTYLSCDINAFSKALGSDYSFLNTRVDIRQFIALPGTQTIGVQVLGSFTNGTVPFQYLPRLFDDDFGGLRGYYSERYRAENMVMGQVAYRRHLFWRLGATAFAGVGDVFKTVEDFDADRLKIAGGLGLRIRIGDDGSKLSLDYAVRRDGGGAFYFNFGDYF